MYNRPFSFWGSLDQRWIDKKIEEYWIDDYEISELVKEFGYSAEQVIDSPNPVIFCLIELIINQIIEKLEEFDLLSSNLIEKIREQLQDSVFVNCLDSHIQSEYIFESLEDEIIEELESLEDYTDDKLQTIKDLFLKYDF